MDENLEILGKIFKNWFTLLEYMKSCIMDENVKKWAYFKNHQNS
jgi:hypothetical protein